MPNQKDNITHRLALNDARPTLTNFVHSDWLPMLPELALKIPALAPLLEDYLQIRLVIDANYVHRELQWRLKSRSKLDARTRLHESAESGVLILFAPVQLEAEIEEHLSDIANRSGTTLEQARTEWRAFRQKLHLYTPKSLTLRRGIPVVDPDDLPYIAACQELGAQAVYTKDKHFEMMKAPVIKIAIDGSTQSYARANSVRLAIMVGSVFSVTVGIGAINAAVRAITEAFQAFQKLHPLIQLGVVAALVFVFVDPKMRAKLAGVWDAIGRVANPIFQAVALGAQQFEIASVNLDLARREIQAVLPPRQKRSALAHARALCLVHKKPITLSHLEKLIRSESYTTKARDFTTYLRRQLQSSGQFVESAEGWRLQTDPRVGCPLQVEAVHG